MDHLADRGALGAMGAAVDRAVPAGFLTHPDAVLHFGGDGATDRAMGADVAPPLDILAVIGRSGLGAAGHACADGPQRGQPGHAQPRCAQEAAPVNGLGGKACCHLRKAAALRGLTGSAFDQHLLFLPAVVAVGAVEGFDMLGHAVARAGPVIAGLLREPRPPPAPRQTGCGG